MNSTRDQYEFLPAALEVQETPPSPLGRAIIWTLIVFITITIVWACVGKIDIVVVAQGKIIPTGRDKIIQPLEIGVVRHIYVREGQPVKKGDLLVEMDATQTGADTERLTAELTQTRHDIERNSRLASMAWPENTKTPELLDAVSRVCPAGRLARNPGEHSGTALQQQLLCRQIEEGRAKIAALQSEIAQREAELDTTGQVIKKLQASLPLITERVHALKELVDKNFGPRQQYLELEQQRLEQSHDLATQQARQHEIRAAITTANQQKLALLAQIKTTALVDLSGASVKSAALEQELRKAENRRQLQRLTAPVDGVVHQLQVHTLGGVVTPAQQLMIIVPQQKPLDIEAIIANKDIGFIEPGQVAEIKVETFPFTKYGTLVGKVVKTSSNAVADEKLGLIYKAQVLLESSIMNINGKPVQLVPGMAVTVEVKTGQRRLIEYVLSPLVQYAQESGRER